MVTHSDLVISCGLTVSHPQIVDFAISDHYCVFCEISVCTVLKLWVIRERSISYLYDDSATTFMELMSSLLPLTFPSVDIYAENFSLRLSKCINSVAPLKTKTVSGTTKTPWRHSTPIVKLRRDSRRAERQWKLKPPTDCWFCHIWPLLCLLWDFSMYCTKTVSDKRTVNKLSLCWFCHDLHGAHVFSPSSHFPLSRHLCWEF